MQISFSTPISGVSYRCCAICISYILFTSTFWGFFCIDVGYCKLENLVKYAKHHFHFKLYFCIQLLSHILLQVINEKSSNHTITYNTNICTTVYSWGKLKQFSENVYTMISTSFCNTCKEILFHCSTKQ